MHVIDAEDRSKATQPGGGRGLRAQRQVELESARAVRQGWDAERVALRPSSIASIFRVAACSSPGRFPSEACDPRGNAVPPRAAALLRRPVADPAPELHFGHAVVDGVEPAVDD